MRRFLVALTFALLITPGFAEAKTTTWNMEGVQKLEGWNHKNFTKIDLTAAGLTMQADQQGQLAHGGPIGHKVDTIAITYSSPSGVSGIFFWQTPDQSGNTAYHIPLNLPRSMQSTTVVLDLSQVPKWTPNSKLIGFNINPGTQLTLKRIELTGPGLFDTVYYSLQSFFTFDPLRAYAVNFMWGPRMVGSADAVAVIYDTIPPIGKSWNQGFYVLLLLGFAVTFYITRKKGTHWLVPFLMIVASIWILYDLRMGTAIVKFATTDVKTWWSKPVELQDFRDRGSFTAFTKVAQEFITEEDETYALITPSGWPYFGAMTYETYPAIPLSSSDNLQDVSLWIVYHMPRVTLDESNRLVVNGAPISPPGEVLLQFEPGAFIFRTTE